MRIKSVQKQRQQVAKVAHVVKKPKQFSVPKIQKPTVKCAICLEDIKHNAFTTSCQHVFHKQCICKMHTLSCPCCRTVIANPDIFHTANVFRQDVRNYEVQMNSFEQDRAVLLLTHRIKIKNMKKKLNQANIKMKKEMEEEDNFLAVKRNELEIKRMKLYNILQDPQIQEKKEYEKRLVLLNQQFNTSFSTQTNLDWKSFWNTYVLTLSFIPELDVKLQIRLKYIQKYKKHFNLSWKTESKTNCTHMSYEERLTKKIEYIRHVFSKKNVNTWIEIGEPTVGF